MWVYLQAPVYFREKKAYLEFEQRNHKKRECNDIVGKALEKCNGKTPTELHILVFYRGLGLPLRVLC